MLGTREARDRTEHQNGGQSRERSDAGVRHKSARIRIGRHGGGHLGIELVDATIEPLQKLEAIVAAAGGVRQERERLQLGQAAAGPQGGPEGHALIEGNGMKTVFDHRADADETKAVFEQRAQVARLWIGNPDRGEAIMLEQVEKVPSVAAIGLGLTNDHRADLGSLADDQGMAESLEEVVEPQRVPGAFDAHGDWPRQGRVELFNGIAAVDELPLKELAAACIEHGHLLLARMQIAPHQDHEFGLLSIDAVALGSAETTNYVRPFS